MKKEIRYKDYKAALSVNKINDMLSDNKYNKIVFLYVKDNENDDGFIRFKTNFIKRIIADTINVKISEKDVFEIKQDGFYFKGKPIIEKEIKQTGNIIEETFRIKWIRW